MPVTLSIVPPTPQNGNTITNSLTPDDLSLHWANETGFDVLPYHRRVFAGWLEDGFEDTVIMLAIAETMAAPHPSWTYLQSIMSHLRRDRAFTMEAYDARQSAFRRRYSYRSHDRN